MVLTHTQRIPNDSNSPFPTTQLFILAICRVAEPIALTSIFPYAWPMVKDFNIGDKHNASFFAGILISSFSLSEALTGMLWGSLSDRVGRKPVLLFGCLGTTLSMLVVGFSTNFAMALVGRTLGGFLNGNIGVIQTMVGEIVKRPEHEPRAYAVMPFVWSIGTIIGPAVGGTLAQPAINYPSIFSDTIFAKFPYLLPNLVCSIMLLISILAGYLFLTETHPDMQPWSTPAELDNSAAETPLMATAGAMDNSGVDLRADSYGTFNEVTVQKEERWNVNADGSSRPISIVSVEKQKIFTKRVVMLVVALGIFTYHNMTYDHLLPIFLQDDRNGTEVLRSGMLSIPGGLGLRTQDVGVIMSFNGLIALLVQGVIFPIFAEWLGVWKLFLMVTILHPIAYFIVPFLAFLPQNLLYPGIYGCLTIRNFFAILGYPVILILLKEACPKASVLGTINGLAASAGAACRTVAPPVAGLLYSLGATQGFTGIAWWGSCLVAVIGTIQLYWVRRAKNGASVVRPVRTCMIPTECSRRESVVVHILVNDV